MAHLNLVMIHPFRDGNGRMARCLQTLVIARDRMNAPVFSSVEEYLGRNTQSYYDILAEVGQAAWHPENDARPWIRFMLTAHYRQAKTHLRRIEEIERLYSQCYELATQHGLPDRCAAGLSDAALGLRLRRNSYLSGVESSTGDEYKTQREGIQETLPRHPRNIGGTRKTLARKQKDNPSYHTTHGNELTATRDLQAMVRAGLLIPRGETRGRYYVGSPSIFEVRRAIRARRPPRGEYDPFVVAEQKLQLSLDTG